MRYIIIPLATILYVLWSYKSIKNIINKQLPLSAQFWLAIHLSIVVTYLLVKALEFTIINW